jgi:hypothetical protein
MNFVCKRLRLFLNIVWLARNIMPVIKKTKSKVLRPDKKNGSASFLERPLPESDEVSRFEEAVRREVINEDMDDNLSAIYHDGRGQLVDVSRVNKRKSLRLLVIFKRLFVLTIIACGLYGAYYYFQQPKGEQGINLRVQAPEEIIAGAPFSYELIYQNDSGLALSGVQLEVILPASFIISESVPAASGINSWSLGNLQAGESGRVIVSGRLIAPADSANVVTANLSYTPANFSSEFKKEASANTVISGLGFGVSINYLNTALIGQNNELRLSLNNFKDNQISSFYLEITGSDNFKIEKVGEDKTGKETAIDVSTIPIELINTIQPAGEASWLIANLASSSDNVFVIPIAFTLQAKNQDKEDLSLRLISKEADGSRRIFWEKTVSFEIMKSDLNISLSLSGEKSDRPVDFGETLNYQLSYSNNGDSTLRDLVLMAVIKGDLVRWSSLHDPLGGSVAGNAIVWTREQLSALAEVAPGSSGSIDFSVPVKAFDENNLGAEAIITSYAQYGLNNQSQGGDDNKSNTIKSPLNSDLSLSEKILYFNEDNLPVGSGPLPPRVGENTSVRVFWTIKNNLHDLENLKVSMDLPAGVNFAGGANTNVGDIFYDQANNQVVWRLGLLPLSVYRADAEFNINITPTESDRNKILVLSSGSLVTAVDAVTKADLQRKIQAKTTKLEDDEIAGLSNNGRVE